MFEVQRGSVAGASRSYCARCRERASIEAEPRRQAFQAATWNEKQRVKQKFYGISPIATIIRQPRIFSSELIIYARYPPPHMMIFQRRVLPVRPFTRQS